MNIAKPHVVYVLHAIKNNNIWSVAFSFAKEATAGSMVFNENMTDDTMQKLLFATESKHAVALIGKPVLYDCNSDGYFWDQTMEVNDPRLSNTQPTVARKEKSNSPVIAVFDPFDL